MNKKKELAKNTFIILAGKVSTQMITFFMLPLYTSYLLTEEYGLVDLITTYVTLIIPIITLDTEMAMFRFLIERRKDKKETKKLLANNFSYLLIALSIFTVFYLIVVQFFTIPFKYLILLDIIICVLSSNFLQIARGMGRNTVYSIGCIVTGLSIVALNILFIVFLGWGAFGMLLGTALGNFICDIYLFITLKLYKNLTFKYNDKALIKSMLKYSIPLVPSTLGWWIINISDKTIISIFLGVAFNGIYAVANKFATIFSSLLNIFNLSWGESASLHINDSDRNKFFSDVFNTIFKLFASLGLGIIACMPFIFPILINSRYNDAYNYIPILILGIRFNVLLILYNGVYIAKKLTKQVANTTIIGAIVNVVVNLVFVKFIGLYAAAISTATSCCVMTLYRHFDSKKYIKIQYDKKSFISAFVLFILVMLTYYYRNIYLQLISLIIVIIYAYLTNRKLLKNFSKSFLNKLIKRNV